MEHKEGRFDYVREMEYLQKMDAVNLQGIWLNFPVVTSSGKWKIGATIYLELLRAEMEEVRKGKRIVESPEQIRKRLMQEVERRITEQDNDDLFVILVA